MKFTKTQIDTATELAERIAKRELRLSRLSELQVPTEIIEAERVLVDEACANIIIDELAEKLLPQARVVVQMREAREEFVRKKTTLGQFLEAAEGLERLDKPSTIGSTLQDADATEHWFQFCTALRGKDQNKIHSALMELLSDALFEFIYTIELPALPPPYIIPE